MAPSIPVILHFAVAAFFGNVAFCAMGFGMGICFLFLYQLGAISGLVECCGLPGLKNAVFLQTIALAVIQPIMLWNVGLRNNIRWEIMLLMIPSQLVAAPLGQYLQDFTPAPVLKAIVGVLTIGVAVWQLYNIYRSTRNKGSTIAVNLDVKEKTKGPVYFMIGSQRSGSNWLPLLINKEHPCIAAPHPPHIFKNFYPILSTFGDLSSDTNFDVLVNSVCDYVEANPVPWLDKSQSQIKLDRVMIKQECEGKRSLIMLFEVIMDIFSKENGCKTWLCKSMTVGVYHDELYRHFGDRLRYIYIYRDPRDVCLSFKKAPVGPAHYYIISATWAIQQRIALHLTKTFNSVHAVSYESLLHDSEAEIKSMGYFLSEIGNVSRSNAYVVPKTDSTEAKNRAGKSTLWKNLTRGSSFAALQLNKWVKSLEKDGVELEMIESASWDVMEQLGYVHATERKREYNEDEKESFKVQDEEGRRAKNAALKEEDFLDWERREKQQAILLRKNQGMPIEESSALTIANPATTNNFALSCPTETKHKESYHFNELEVSKRNSMNDFGMELRSIGIELKKELWPPRLITMWMFIAGLVSGFLGGLISVRGPPLIVFFFFYDYPKVQIKANGTVIAAVNTLVRIITYMVKPTPAEYGHDNWFVGEEVWLYVVVAVVGILASPIGIYLSRYLNKWTYKAGLAVLLVINGITMITTSIIKLSG